MKKIVGCTYTYNTRNLRSLYVILYTYNGTYCNNYYYKYFIHKFTMSSCRERFYRYFWSRKLRDMYIEQYVLYCLRILIAID